VATRADNQYRRYVLAALERNGTRTKRNTKPATPYLNHGRWVANCSCNGAELVSEDADMLCGSCGTITPLVWPGESAAVEEAVRLRPTHNQNWVPGEPVADLVADNIRHGIGRIR
jgi:hypothetical protein